MGVVLQQQWVKCLSLHVEQSVQLQSAPKTKITDYVPAAAVLFTPETLCPRYTIIFFQQISKKSLFQLAYEMHSAHYYCQNCNCIMKYNLGCKNGILICSAQGAEFDMSCWLTGNLHFPLGKLRDKQSCFPERCQVILCQKCAFLGRTEKMLNFAMHVLIQKRQLESHALEQNYHSQVTARGGSHCHTKLEKSRNDVQPLLCSVWDQAWPGADVGATITGVAQDAKPLELLFLVDSFNQPSLSAKSWGNGFSDV